MKKKFKSINGYYKFYNRYGFSCRIKIASEINGRTIIKFKNEEEEQWLYHIPDTIFKNSWEVVNFILKNLVKGGRVFNVSPSITTPIIHNTKQSNKGKK